MGSEARKMRVVPDEAMVMMMLSECLILLKP
jgi:hypothetical protein